MQCPVCGDFAAEYVHSMVRVYDISEIAGDRITCGGAKACDREENLTCNNGHVWSLPESTLVETNVTPR